MLHIYKSSPNKDYKNAVPEQYVWEKNLWDSNGRPTATSCSKQLPERYCGVNNATFAILTPGPAMNSDDWGAASRSEVNMSVICPSVSSEILYLYRPCNNIRTNFTARNHSCQIAVS